MSFKVDESRLLLGIDENNHLFAEYPVQEGASIIVRIVADSITDGGSRLTTMIWEYPRNIHAEIMTHRVLSRNLSSSRAIPTKVLRDRVLRAPVVPVFWGQNQKGMQASTEVADIALAREWWLQGCDLMAAHHAEGERLGLHKQIVNRVIEPWMQAVGLISGTDFANLFHQRKHPDAEPNFQVLATLAWVLYHNHMPTHIPCGGWHLPFIQAHDLDAALSTEELIRLSTARCARVSYLTHEGKRDRGEDFRLHDQLAATASKGADPMHASPFEHPAQAVGARIRIGNFEGWRQYRKTFMHEAGPNTDDRCERCGCWAGRHVVGCV